MHSFLEEMHIAILWNRAILWNPVHLEYPVCPCLMTTKQVGCFHTFSLSLKPILSLQGIIITSRTEM